MLLTERNTSRQPRVACRRFHLFPRPPWQSLFVLRSSVQLSRSPAGTDSVLRLVVHDTDATLGTPTYNLLAWVPLVSSGIFICLNTTTASLTLYHSSAKDQLTGQPVAVKKIMKPFSTPVLSKRTYRELKLLKHLRHENVRVLPGPARYGDSFLEGH